MCRIFLFFSNSNQLNISYPILTAEHSLLKQSYFPQYLPGIVFDKHNKIRNPRYHQNGFGILFADGKEYVKIKSTKNIRKKSIELSNLLSDKYSRFILAYIRKTNSENLMEDLQPFYYRHIFFIHNGDFRKHFDMMKKCLLPFINPKYMDIVGDNLDSKLLFSLLLTFLFEENEINIQDKLSKFFKVIKECKTKDFDISVNFILINVKNNLIIIVRNRTCNKPAPALYYKYTDSLLVASEPVEKDNSWTLLNKEMLIYNNGSIQIIPIDKD